MSSLANRRVVVIVLQFLLLVVAGMTTLATGEVVAAQRTTTAAPYQPGSVLGFMNCWNPQTNSSTFLLTLWDATTGDNYTTVIPGNWSWGSNPLIYPAERVLAYGRLREGWYGATDLYLSFFDYAPRTAPTLSKKYKTCKMPDFALDAAPFFLNGKLYAFSHSIIYYVTLPKEHEGPCGLEVAAPNPLPYTVWSAVNAQNFRGVNFLSFIMYGTLVVVSPRDGGILPNPSTSGSSGSETSYSNSAPSDALLSVAEFPINASMRGTWNYLAQDPETLDGFYYTSGGNSLFSFWRGAAITTTTSPTSSEKQFIGMTWSPVNGSGGWNESLWGIQLDPRVRQFGAPALCTTFPGLYCVNIEGGSVYSIPSLASECSESGTSGYGLYDPDCH